MFDLFGILFPIVFFMVLGTFIMTIAKGLSTGIRITTRRG